MSDNKHDAQRDAAAGPDPSDDRITTTLTINGQRQTCTRIHAPRCLMHCANTNN